MRPASGCECHTCYRAHEEPPRSRRSQPRHSPGHGLPTRSPSTRPAVADWGGTRDVAARSDSPTRCRPPRSSPTSLVRPATSSARVPHVPDPGRPPRSVQTVLPRSLNVRDPARSGGFPSAEMGAWGDWERPGWEEEEDILFTIRHDSSESDGPRHQREPAPFWQRAGIRRRREFCVQCQFAGTQGNSGTQSSAARCDLIQVFSYV